MWVSFLRRLADTLDGPDLIIEAGAQGTEEKLSRRSLRDLAYITGSYFGDLGVRPGDRIATLLSTGRPLLQAIFGAWAANAGICVLSPSIDVGRSSLSRERLDRMLRVTKPKIIVASGTDADVAATIAHEIGAKLIAPADLPTEGVASEPAPNGPEDLAFVQFTSGSTGDPNAIAITHQQLTMNVELTAERTGFSADSCFVSWLPIYHDFGFVVGAMMPIYSASRLILVPTEAFAKNPLIWLRVMTRERATHSGAPPSAAAVVLKPIFTRRLSGIDLSSLQVVFFGAEPVSVSCVEEFEDFFAQHGLARGAISAGYGLAEATLTVAVRPAGSNRRLAWIDKDAFHNEGRISLRPPESLETFPLLSNGPPLPGVKIRIADANGADLGEGAQGRILICSPMVTKRYISSDEDPQPGGWLDTGDLGFLLDGEVYVAGRMKDVVIRAGATIHAHQLEEAASRAFPDLVQRAVAFSVPRKDNLRDKIVIGVELRRLPPSDAFAADLRAVIQRDIGFQLDEVVCLPKGSIPRTTSGKVQRGRARDLYRAGELALGSTESSAMSAADVLTNDIIALIRELAKQGDLPRDLATAAITAETTLEGLSLDSLGRMILLSALDESRGVLIPGDILSPGLTLGGLAAKITNLQGLAT